MMNYLHIDCEMGGREIKYSLLTAYLLVTDENFNKISELSLEVKPDDGIYIVNGGAMRVNGIDLAEHDERAISYKQAGKLLYNFLKEQSNGYKLVPVGHGVKGDIEHLFKLISEGSWEQFCTYHYIDTSVVLQFLRACGKMPRDTDGSIEALSKYFDLEPKDVGEYTCYHDARYDAVATMEVLRKFIELGKK